MAGWWKHAGAGTAPLSFLVGPDGLTGHVFLTREGTAPWVAFREGPGGAERFGRFPTRAAAMRAVASATDPKKGHAP